MNLTYVELFAGAGGMSLGLEMAGWQCVAHAEIEPHARAVLRHHWPNTPLYGDVSQLDGRQFKGVTMLTGGSPCQDLSIAGKRAGMTQDSGTRSSLFFEQIRIWHESEAPFILWENVYGAFSSQQGRDFAAVLSAIVGGAVPVPADGWRGAGVASGPAGVAAWRTLDAQYFGVPQRRRRVFVLGVRGGGVDPAEVLSLAEGLSGDFAPSQEARQGASAVAGASVVGLRTGFSTTGSVGYIHDVMPSLPHLTGLNCPGAQMLGVLDVSHTTYEWHGMDSRFKPTTEALTLNTRQDNGQGQVLILRNREGKPGGGKGPLLSAERSLTLGTHNDQVLFPSVAPTMQARDYKDATTLAMGQVGTPRRLTPTECERLMGWPDQHTAIGVNEKGKTYELADTARYKLCGNGIASPVTAWIGFQIRAAVEAID